MPSMQPDQHRFLLAERKGEKTDAFQLYKLALAIFCTSMLFYGFLDQKNNPKDVHGTHTYTDYVSNWNDMSCTAWAVFNAIAAFQPALPASMYSLISGMNAIAPTFSIGVAIAFWGLLPADRQSTDIVSLHQHAFLAVITVLDMLIVASPFRFFHVLSTWVFAGAYSINTLAVFFLFGEDRDSIYPFINYTEQFLNGIKFDLIMTFGVQTVVFCVLYGLSKTKFWLHRRLTTAPGVDGPGDSKTELLEKDIYIF